MHWSEGTWTHEPTAQVVDGDDLVVSAAEGSDAWRTTSYGFIHDSEHALLAPFPPESAIEVEFTLALTEQFLLRIELLREVTAGLLRKC